MFNKPKTKSTPAGFSVVPDSFEPNFTQGPSKFFTDQEQPGFSYAPRPQAAPEPNSEDWDYVPAVPESRREVSASQQWGNFGFQASAAAETAPNVKDLDSFPALGASKGRGRGSKPQKTSVEEGLGRLRVE